MLHPVHKLDSLQVATTGGGGERSADLEETGGPSRRGPDSFWCPC